MRPGTHLRVALAGGLLAVVAWAGASPGRAAVAGAPARVRSSIVQERRALHALPAPSRPTRAGYARSLTHVRTALARLHTVRSLLAAAARGTGPLPHGPQIELQLDAALSADNHAATHIGQALWLLQRGVPTDPTLPAQARDDLRQALTASTALLKLVR